MLSHNEILKRIEQGEIKIFYSFLKSEDGSNIDFYENELEVNLSTPNSLATQFFYKSLYSDRLRMTVGPIAKTHRLLPVAGRKTYKGHHQCTDLRENENKLIIEPFEAVSIASNERIILGARTASIVLPRVTNTDSGLLLTPAYIDPYYNGIMRVVVFNGAEHKQTLSLLEPIAQMFFFSVEGQVDQAFRDSFSSKSVFYGNNWNRIINESVDPFPRRKIPLREQTKFEKLTTNLGRYRASIAKSLVTFGTITFFAALFLAIGKFQSTIDDFKKLEKKLDDNTMKIQTIDKSLPITGNNDIRIKTGNRHGSFNTILDIPTKEISSVWLQIDESYADSLRNIDLNYDIKAGSNSRETVIEFSAILSDIASSDVRIPILWMVVK